MTELLPEYVLGVLPPEQLALVDHALATSAFLRAEADRLSEALVTGLLPSLPRVPPSADARARLLATLG